MTDPSDTQQGEGYDDADELILCQAILDGMNFPCWVIDETGRIVYYSNSAAVVRPTTGEGVAMQDIFPGVRLADVLTTGLPFVDSDDDVDLEVTLTPLANAREHKAWYIAQGRDLEAEHRWEKDLKKANEELGQFLYAASHDLQEPLRNVSIFVDKLLNSLSDLTPKQERWAGHISSGCFRMLALAQDMGDLNRAGASTGDELVNNVASMVDEAAENVMASLQIDGGHIDTSKLGHATIWCDRGSMVRVFQNLLSNSIKYAKPGEPARISVYSKALESSLSISVRDEGEGIPEKSWEEVFLPFKRASRRSEGSGLGLALCNRVVSRLGGKIYVEDSGPWGTVITLEMPYNKG